MTYSSDNTLLCVKAGQEAAKCPMSETRRVYCCLQLSLTLYVISQPFWIQATA
ncbi:hypothetical protein J6590_019294 [Homalodisca vitripennis]|nr:hypothetical protein J6590_019294 [Homalodisca vitripennis]